MCLYGLTNSKTKLMESHHVDGSGFVTLS
uniref:Gpm274 n=1 Tax=Arundo donax TaxID=35708 RepID=A0A0A9FBP1_ARUDO